MGLAGASLHVAQGRRLCSGDWREGDSDLGMREEAHTVWEALQCHSEVGKAQRSCAKMWIEWISEGCAGSFGRNFPWPSSRKNHFCGFLISNTWGLYMHVMMENVYGASLFFHFHWSLFRLIILYWAPLVLMECLYLACALWLYFLFFCFVLSVVFLLFSCETLQRPLWPSYSVFSICPVYLFLSPFLLDWLFLSIPFYLLFGLFSFTLCLGFLFSGNLYRLHSTSLICHSLLLN